MTIVRSIRGLLEGPTNRVDTLRMNVPEQSLQPFEASCLAVLSCYAVRDAAERAASAEHGGWLDRIHDFPGLEPSSLTSIHGYLIAQGLIRFEFTGRSVGLQYQLSPSGRDCVLRGSLNLSEDSRNADAGPESAGEIRSQAA